MPNTCNGDQILAIRQKYKMAAAVVLDFVRSEDIAASETSVFVYRTILVSTSNHVLMRAIATEL